MFLEPKKIILFLFLFSLIQPVSAQNNVPDFSNLRVKDSDEMILEEGEVSTLSFWFIDPDGGYQVQTIYLRFWFTEDNFIDISSNYETWTVEIGDDLIELIGADSWISDEFKRLDLSFRLLNIPDFDEMYVSVRVVDVYGESSEWQAWETPLELGKQVTTVEVDSEEEGENSFIFILFLIFPAVVGFLLINNMKRSRKTDHPAYMDIKR